MLIFNIAYLITYVLLLFVLVLCFTKKVKKSRLIAVIVVLSIIELSMFGQSMFVESFRAKEWINCVIFSLFDWKVFYQLAFVYSFLGQKINRQSAFAVAGLVCFDAVMCYTNPINHYLCDFYSLPFGHIREVLGINAGVFYYVHFIIGYMVMCTSLYLLLKKMLTTSKYYRKRYSLLFVIILIELILNMLLAIIKKSAVNYTMFVSGISAVVMFYVAFWFSPRKLMRNLQVYVNNMINIPIILLDKDGQVLTINKSGRELIPKDAIESGDSLRDFLGIVDEDGKYKFKFYEKTYEISYKRILDDKDNTVVAEAFIFYDCSEVEEKIEFEHMIATRDKLTGIYNRQGFFEHANDFLYKNESETGFALIVSGINGFKAINSTYGTRVGDIVLLDISQRYVRYHHSYPLIFGRSAEGKFVCLLPFDYVDEFAGDMSKIDIEMNDDVTVHVEMSHGFVVLDDTAKSLDYYYERALLALSECKCLANTPILEYTQSMEESVNKRQVIVESMHDAIRNKEFFIEIQPQINLETRSVCGAEVLVRWNHPTLGRVSPAEFIPVFEENGFITNLDIYVWEEAARVLKALRDDDVYSGTFSINVSRVDITAIDVAEQLSKIVDKYGLEPRDLHVEITESACNLNSDRILYTFNKLHDKGFIIEIDDFGSGYSSLNTLSDIPFDVVKLDMVFMREEYFDFRSAVVMTSLVRMIHDLEASIIVEGVENEGNIENSVRFGADVIQGYYFSRPLRVSKFKKFVQGDLD